MAAINTCIYGTCNNNLIIIIIVVIVVIIIHKWEEECYLISNLKWFWGGGIE